MVLLKILAYGQPSQSTSSSSTNPIETILFFNIFIGVVLGLGIYVHANNNNKSGMFWGIMTALFGILGLIMYAISLASDNPTQPQQRRRNQQRIRKKNRQLNNTVPLRLQNRKLIDQTTGKVVTLKEDDKGNVHVQDSDGNNLRVVEPQEFDYKNFLIEKQSKE